MGRLREQTLERVETFSDRVLAVAEELQKQKRFARVIDQLVGAGTSPGANAFEADEAMSAKDFAKCLGTVIKELSECRYWLRLIGRRGWVKPGRLEPLLAEATELKPIFGSMVIRTRRSLDRSNARPKM